MHSVLVFMLPLLAALLSQLPCAAAVSGRQQACLDDAPVAFYSFECPKCHLHRSADLEHHQVLRLVTIYGDIWDVSVSLTVLHCHHRQGLGLNAEPVAHPLQFPFPARHQLSIDDATWCAQERDALPFTSVNSSTVRAFRRIVYCLMRKPHRST